MNLVQGDPALVPEGAMLVSAGPGAVERSYEELRTDMTELFQALEQRRRPEVSS